MSLLHAALLGLVEGVSEFLPISSTGHLILASYALGLRGEAIKTFEVVIQAGALAAVVSLYRRRVASMWRGLFAQDAAGRALLCNVVVSFLPAAVLGIALHRPIKAHLFSAWPVVAALALGGLLMIGLHRWLIHRSMCATQTIESITIGQALLIGVAQCLSLWPGTSRAMVTLVAGLLIGLPAPAAAEYSFLLALPTLGAATLFDIAQGAGGLHAEVGWGAVVCGFLSAAIVAALVMRGFVQYLTHRGLAPFGWYRLGLASLVWGMMQWS